MALTVSVLGAGSTPAMAHNSQSRKQGFVYAGNNQCVRGDDRQNHGGALLSRSVNTISLLANGNLCGGAFTVDPGHIAQRGEIYKDGQWPPCAVGGWQYNPSRSYDFYWQTNEDVWFYNGCNNGPGVHVYLTHDIWHAVWGVNTGSWLIGSFRPATAHCHCP